MDGNDILDMIVGGQMDEHLITIERAVRAREDILAQRLGQDLRVGDRVRFNQQARPLYLRGVEATVVRKLQKNVMVRLDKPVGKFRGDIKTPPSLLEQVPVAA